MSCTVNYSNELPVSVIVHPVKITTNYIFWHEKNKCLLESIFPRQHGSLNPFSISYTCSYIPVLLFNLHAFLNNFGSSFLYFLLKDTLFLYQVLFPDLYIDTIITATKD